MQDSFDVTTIIFLALAVFVIWRLRSVLGQKTGAERSPFKPVDRSRTEPQARSDGDNVVRLPG
ncbi:calcium-binding protein, partial [Methylobacterium radiotolerans]